MNIHPDVLAAHAEFGGDLEMMQKAYDWQDLRDEIERLEKALETAREALEEIARQRLPVEIEDDLDPDFATGYEGCILRARVAIRTLSQKKEG